MVRRTLAAVVAVLLASAAPAEAFRRRVAPRAAAAAQGQTAEAAQPAAEGANHEKASEADLHALLAEIEAARAG